jgi:hypothetical protein
MGQCRGLAVASKSTDLRIQVGSGAPIERFREDVAGLSPADFEERHGSAFLLLSAAGMRQVKSVTSTELFLLEEEKDEVLEPTAGLSVLVFPVRPASRSHTHLVTVGRTSKNDVSIPDISVSRFHAFFKRGPGGELQLHDTGSTNGTTVNSLSVCTKEAGPPTNLTTGDNVRFGQIEMTFLEAEALRSFVSKFGD